MSELPNGFDAEQEPEAGDFTPIPAGEYEAVIAESAMMPTKSGNGSYLKLRFEVIGPTHAGRMLFANLNLDNPSAEAVKIARGQLAAICRAVGVLKPKDSQELHNLPLLVKIKIEAERDGYDAQNKITSFKPKKADVSGIAGPKAEEPVKPTAAPWKKRAAVTK